MKTFPFHRQHDSMQCGIACLQMVCHYFGRDYSSESLSKLCFATTEGVSMLGITEAATSLGLQTASARVGVAALQKAPSSLHSPLEPEPFCGALQCEKR